MEGINPSKAAASLSGLRRKTPNPALDLFRQVPLTWPEVDDWLEAVPKISRTSWRARYYIRYWNVHEKVVNAKLQGTFEPIIGRAESENPPPSLF